MGKPNDVGVFQLESGLWAFRYTLTVDGKPQPKPEAKKPNLVTATYGVKSPVAPVAPKPAEPQKAEYVMECQGTLPMDLDELNQLVADRDPHALAFFGLEEASEEELEEWDAYDLDEEDIPTIADFKEDFEPESPYDCGWTLNVQFVDPNF